MNHHVCHSGRFTRSPFSAPYWVLAVFVAALLAIGLSHGQDESPSKRRPPSIPKPGAAADIRPGSFKNLTPGLSTLNDVTRELGHPASRFDHKGETTLRYTIEPFSRVEVVMAENVVASIVIYLDGTSPRELMEQELGLNQFQPAPIPDEDGVPLGQAYPERGVLFGFAPGDRELNVAQVVLEPIGPEPFIYRVLHNDGRSYRDQLADLDHAQKFGPKNAQCYWLRAKILDEIGRRAEALKNASDAAKLDPQNLQFQLTAARLLADVDRTQAVAQTSTVFQKATAAPLIKAKAAFQLGHLADQKAIDRYQQAIQLAAPLANDHRPRMRLQAKQLLFDAHLAVAQEIAWGNYRRKREVVQKWLGRADDLANNLIEHEQQDEFLKLQAARAALAAYVAMGGVTDPTQIANQVVESGGKLFESNADPLYRARIQWEVAVSLMHAGQLEFSRRAYPSTVEYAEAGIKLLNSINNARVTAGEQDYVLGRFYFLIGAVNAVHKGDHTTAVKWYDKAEPLLRNPVPLFAKHDLVRHADRFVSMGVSYWHGGARNKALELTERGTELLEVAVQRGQAGQRVLAIPYGNLASMQEQLGRDSEAHRYAAKAARIEATNGTQQQHR